MHRAFAVFISLAVLPAILGCHTGSREPTRPDPTAITQNTSCLPHPGTYLWGMWDVRIDTSDASVEIAPLRAPAFTANVVKFLHPASGSGYLAIKITDLSEFATEGRIVVDVTLYHPFPGLDMYTGFDVCGVFVHEGVLGFQHGSNVVDVADGLNSAIVENADGYTCWMSPALFPADGTILTFLPGKLGTPGFPGQDAADANGFKYFAHGLAKDESVASFFTDEANFLNRGMFTTTSPCTREYRLRFPKPGGSPILEFQYAVTANWEKPDETLTGDPEVLDVPGDFLPEANACEPIHINVTDKSTTWYVDEQNRGGNITLDLEILDWDGLDGIGQIHISGIGDLVPGGTATFDPGALVWLPGTFNSSVTTVDIPGALPAGIEDQYVLVAVESAPPATYDQGFGTPAPDWPLSAYCLHELAVSDEPFATLAADGTATVEPYFDGFGPAGTLEDPIPTEWYLTLDASASTGLIDEYLWEMNGDDLFDEASGMIVSAEFPDTGTHVIKLKVTDGAGGEDIYQLPGSYEVVKGTYVHVGVEGPWDGSRFEPYPDIPGAADIVGQNGYLLVLGDHGTSVQHVYTNDLLLTDSHTGTRIQGYYGPSGLAPMQTGYVRITGDNITFDGFEVTGNSAANYQPYNYNSKLGSDNAQNALLRHIYVHDLGSITYGNGIVCWNGGDLTVQNCLMVYLNMGVWIQNRVHHGTPDLSIVNCTIDRLSNAAARGWYRSGGSASSVNCIWTDIGSGSNTAYISRSTDGPFDVTYTCTSDTSTPPDGGVYFFQIVPGAGCITDDPLYVDPYLDHHLQEGSPAEDTGDPSIEDFDGTASDMGCYGGPYGDWNFED